MIGSPTRPAIGKSPLPGNGYFLTDGGIETTLIFHDGIELPLFAAYVLLRDEAGRNALLAYYRRHLIVAATHRLGFVLESPTWRASRDWGEKLGHRPDEIVRLNGEAIFLMRTLRNKYRNSVGPIVISGCVGPHGDGYDPGKAMTHNEATDYHRHQVTALAGAGADMVTDNTMTNVPEAIGVTRAAGEAGVPCVISFTVETDGRLPTGQGLGDAITEVDAATSSGPAYYMINCAHPDHFEAVLHGEWTGRIGGVRANASRMSHAELDESEVLDEGDPHEFGDDHARLLELLPNLRVLGGCCGTDHRHVNAVGHAIAGSGCAVA